MARPQRFIQQIANTLTAKNQEAARALPDSKGGEVPKQLQTYRTEVYSYFTLPSNESQLVYSAENWVRIKMLLETAGPVSVGTLASIAPVFSGNGILLDPGVPFEAYLAKGNRFYITSQTVNRIAVTIEPVPWLEQIDADTVATQLSVRSAVITTGQAIVNAIANLVGLGTTTSSSGKTASQLPAAPVTTSSQNLRPRLTPIVLPRKIRR